MDKRLKAGTDLLTGKLYKTLRYEAPEDDADTSEDGPITKALKEYQIELELKIQQMREDRKKEAE